MQYTCRVLLCGRTAAPLLRCVVLPPVAVTSWLFTTCTAAATRWNGNGRLIVVVTVALVCVSEKLLLWRPRSGRKPFAFQIDVNIQVAAVRKSIVLLLCRNPRVACGYASHRTCCSNRN